eukprot:scaffold469283_cov22-Prasinocladus_malaysianus.AAC.1
MRNVERCVRRRKKGIEFVIRFQLSGKHVCNIIKIRGDGGWNLHSSSSGIIRKGFASISTALT